MGELSSAMPLASSLHLGLPPSPSSQGSSVAAHLAFGLGELKLGESIHGFQTTLKDGSLDLGARLPLQ